jgi:hypothetical protein
MINRDELLATLLWRGDEVAIKQGRLVITPKSGIAVKSDWKEENYKPLAEDILKVLDLDTFDYVSNTTGRHKGKGWVSLQFVERFSRRKAFMTFNVELDRNRNTRAGKEGTPLPKGHFRALPGSSLVTFWKLTGLKLPRLAAIHDYLGKLDSILFTGNYKVGEKLDKKSILMINISCEEIGQALKSGCTRISTEQTSDYTRTISGQLSDNSRTEISDKTLQQTQEPKGFQPISGTGQKNCGNTVISNKAIQDNVVNLDSYRSPLEEQPVEEWLAPYHEDDLL